MKQVTRRGLFLSFISKSDVLDERLRRHYGRKDFWSTAFVFYRAPEDLNAGETAQLESLLIERAKAAGNELTNVATPKQPSYSDSITTFAGRIEDMLYVEGARPGFLFCAPPA